MEDIIDKHKGMSAVIEAHGPSSDKNREKINKLHQDGNMIMFAMNEWWSFKNHPTPDYWVRSHSGANGGWYMEKERHRHWFDSGTLSGKIPFFNCDTVDGTPLDVIKNVIKGPYLPYDGRHVGGRDCDENFKILDRFTPKPHKFFKSCCDVRGKLTIQEELQKYTNYNELISASPFTVSTYCIVFAILMGCNPIYINGMDLDYFSKAGLYGNLVGDKKWNEVFPNFSPGTSTWKGWRREWMGKDFEIINKSAENIGVEILNLNNNTWYKNFKPGKI
tara:strand:- start:11 stop:838 length:828 start_codon:yes stop_codon:yes gene_type:complete